MSRIDDLIAELCPDGVEYKRLENVADIQRGTRVVRKELATQGTIPVYQNSLTPLGYYTVANQSENIPFVIGAGAAGEIGYSAEPFWAADDCYPILCSNTLCPRYCFHLLLSQQRQIKQKVRKASIPRLNRDVLKQIEVPVPPMEIQQEIVKVLDSFIRLEAELEARRAQYRYYRDQILSFERERESNG